eukprot:gnl/Hemi2/18114_TR5984_c0_g2_i1.p1 gnl/Hemi2/18114_TR5984_c0_g2~~gnl/Hemi2/18114_TR5984_c0_g2_i1.p1  ORF type:complete len:632 (-),score=223.96 gnl/Hemi2/18114_TR5984_c0_g2_i1:68-1963(-)
MATLADGEPAYESQHAPESDLSMEELTIDESLSALDRIKKYISSTIALQRLVHVRSIAATSRQIGYEAASTEIVPLLRQIAGDDEPVIREAFADQISELSTFFVETGDSTAYDTVITTLVPLLPSLIHDSDTQVRMVAAEALLTIAGKIRAEHLEPKIISVVLGLAHDTADEDNRILSIQILNELSTSLGAELCQRHAGGELINLSTDPEFAVRKSVALNLGRVCQISGSDFTARHLLPVMNRLITDDVWGVRKACAESIATVCSALDVEVRAELMIPPFETLLNDQSRWVRNSAHEQLGHFLANFRSDEITPKLLTHFTNLANPKNVGGDSNLTYQCAFCLPAVVQAVGKDRWSEIHPAFSLLVKDIQWKVRRTLAFSLHEIAKILDTAQVEAHLVTAFDLFLKDLDEVKVGVLRHLHDFVSLLTPAAREKYLVVFDHLQSESDSWRFRKYLARELPKLVKIYPAADVYSKLTTLAIRLCVDSVSRVRHEAYTSLAAIFEALKDKPEWKKEFGIKLAAFALQNSYQDRLIFVGACSHILDTCMGPAFEAELLPRVLALAKDKVPNVRLSLARFISEKLMETANFGFNREILATLGALKNDVDWDVSYFANGGGHQSLRKGHSTGPMVVVT